MLATASRNLASVATRHLRATSAAAGAQQVRYLSGDLRPESHSSNSLLDIGTRRIFDEETDMFRETARKYFEERVVPFHEQWELDGQVSRECWTDAGALGLLGSCTSADYGGSGVDTRYAAVVWEEQSYSGCTGPGFALHSDIVMPYIENYGTEEQKQRFLPAMASGECIGAIAMTEPAAGSDLQGMKTHAKQDGDDFILNGSKTFITNGWMADCVIVCAKTDPEAGAKGISLFLVETGMEGFERGRKLKKMGMKAQDTSELFFDNVRVPKANLLGEVNKGFIYLMQELPQERLLIADMGVATAEACFEWAREYTKERKAFGNSLSKIQTIRFKLAEMKTETVVARTFLDHCIEQHMHGRLDTQTASMAKYYGTDLQNKIADDAVQLFGGYGYMLEYPVCRAYIDSRVQQIYGGTNEIMKELISRSI